MDLMRYWKYRSCLEETNQSKIFSTTRAFSFCLHQYTLIGVFIRKRIFFDTFHTYGTMTRFQKPPLSLIHNRCTSDMEKRTEFKLPIGLDKSRETSIRKKWTTSCECSSQCEFEWIHCCYNFQITVKRYNSTKYKQSNNAHAKSASKERSKHKCLIAGNYNVSVVTFNVNFKF